MIACADSPPEPEAAGPRVVLVVEDDVVARNLIAEYLRDAGFKVVEAASAMEAVEILESSTALDIVFADIHMPGPMDGLELARWIGERHPDLPVLVTSGDRDAAVPRETLMRGRYIPKPYIFRDIERRLRSLLGES